MLKYHTRYRIYWHLLEWSSLGDSKTAQVSTFCKILCTSKFCDVSPSLLVAWKNTRMSKRKGKAKGLGNIELALVSDSQTDMASFYVGWNNPKKIKIHKISYQFGRWKQVFTVILQATTKDCSKEVFCKRGVSRVCGVTTLNPAQSSLLDWPLWYFTLSNARGFYSSRESLWVGKG